MNALTAIAFAFAAGFAVGDWTAKYRNNRALEYLCKPATMVALIVAACALDPASGAGTRRTWFVVALVLSLAGDVFLMLPQDLFVAGLASFLLAHVAYIVGLATDYHLAPVGLAIAILILGVMVIPIARRILHALGEQPEFRPPVAVYMVVISAMLVTAFSSDHVVAAAAALLFVVSDTTIAWDRFVAPWPAAPVFIMVTYHLAQAGFVLSLLH